MCHCLSGRKDSDFPAIPSSIEAPDAAAYDAALTVFCDFETRNIGGCDLKKAGAWRYAATRRPKSSALATRSRRRGSFMGGRPAIRAIRSRT